MNRRIAGIRDVARAAGVSTATVSRALNSPAQVSAKTRAAVIEAVAATGYSANPAGRNLRQRRTGSVVALVPNIANPFFSKILAGISEVLRPAGLNLLIGDTLAAEGAGVLDYLDPQRADGVILFDGALPARAVSKRSTGAPPVVMACEWIEGLALPHVGIDNALGAAQATAHLVALGHRAIGHVAGPPANVLTVARRKGFCDTLRDAGLEQRAEWMLAGDFSLRSGAAAARHWLALEQRPTAMFCSSDEMACGFIAALATEGVSVPRDVSVVGFDDIDLARHFHPALTTVHQPRRRLGVAAAECLLALMARKDAPDADRIEPVQLVTRASTRPV